MTLDKMVEVASDIIYRFYATKHIDNEAHLFAQNVYNAGKKRNAGTMFIRELFAEEFAKQAHSSLQDKFPVIKMPVIEIHGEEKTFGGPEWKEVVNLFLKSEFNVSLTNKILADAVGLKNSTLKGAAHHSYVLYVGTMATMGVLHRNPNLDAKQARASYAHLYELKLDALRAAITKVLADKIME